MEDQHMKHIEQLSQELAGHRHTMAEKEWIRCEFVKHDDKRRPARTALQRWMRKVKRAIAFWLLT